jgi:hypothetical protein
MMALQSQLIRLHLRQPTLPHYFRPLIRISKYDREYDAACHAFLSLLIHAHSSPALQSNGPHSVLNYKVYIAPGMCGGPYDFKQ